MEKKLGSKRAFGSLFTSLIMHLIFFIVLGFIFLKGKPYEEYIEIDFTSPVPETRRKLQVKKPIKMLAVMNNPHYKNIVRNVTSEVLTAVKIDGYSDDVYLSPATYGYGKKLAMNTPKTRRIIAPQTKAQSRTETTFVKPEIEHKNPIEISSLPTKSAELELPSDLDISVKIDLNVNEIQQYRKAIKKKIEEEKRYPKLAEENGHEGKVYVKFRLFADGSVKEVRISESSGYQILDREAVRAVVNAAPYPPMPKSIKREYIIIEVPIVFRLSEASVRNISR